MRLKCKHMLNTVNALNAGQEDKDLFGAISELRGLCMSVTVDLSHYFSLVCICSQIVTYF